ncbi:hypothetical protein [Pseudomonas sp. CGJS7]|uniref:hypothetical protein n=1 Tax=Pseudomonas sp. CGJS7 TaxID=3109348 RepID=UPI00300AE43D
MPSSFAYQSNSGSKLQPAAPAIAASMAIAAIISFTFLFAGFAQFDDVTYAWATRRLSEGAVLHRDLVWAHPGYAQVLDVWFGKYLIADIGRFRWHLPVLAALTAGSAAYLLRAKGFAIQCIAAAAIAGLGFAQFSTPSSSWFAVTFAAVSAALAWAAAGTSRPSRAQMLAFASGSLAALSFGSRTINGVAAVAVLLMLLAQTSRTGEQTRRTPWLPLGACAVLLMVCAIVVYSINETTKLYLAAPLLVATLGSCLTVWRNRNEFASRLYLCSGLGWVAGIAPLVLWWLHDGVLMKAFADITTFASSYNQWQSARAANIEDLLSTSLEIVNYRHGINPANALNLLWLLIAALTPALLIVMGRREKFSDPMWLLAASMLFGIFSYPGLLYFPYTTPFLICAFLAWSRNRQTVFAGSLVLALVAGALFVSPRGLYPGSSGESLVGGRLDAARCDLPKCSVYAHKPELDNLKYEYSQLASHVPAGRPLAVLPTISILGFFLPNPSPWHLPKIDRWTPPREVERFQREFERQGNAVIATRRDQYGEAAPVVSRYCVAGSTAEWVFLTTCDATRRCQASTTVRWDAAVGQSVIADSFCARPPRL